MRLPLFAQFHSREATSAVVFHPWLIAMAPMLFLYSHNNEHLSLDLLWLPLAIALGCTGVLWGGLLLALKDRGKAGAITSLFIILFSSFGHIDNALGDQFLRTAGARHLFLSIVLSLLFAVAAVLIIRTRKALAPLSGIMNNAALALLLLLVVSIAWFEIGRFSLSHGRMDQPLNAQLPTPTNHAKLPNIYYIILDAHGRTDVLRQLYGYDNTPFISSLRHMGFYVAANSHANYCETQLSLASSLNMTYLDALAGPNGRLAINKPSAEELIGHNQVCTFLKNYGYRVVAFSSGYDSVKLQQLDVRYNYLSQMNEFYQMLVDTTPIAALAQSTGGVALNAYALHRARVRYTLQKLPETATLTGPVFVFAHLLSPHPPFIFGANGEAKNPNRSYSMNDGSHFMEIGGTRAEYVAGYRAEVAYLDHAVAQTVQQILARSTRPTVIIVQGDHGPGSRLEWDAPEKTYMKERMSILNAYYFSDHSTQGLYPTITPVNTFRLLLHRYFNANLPLLPDHSYFSTWHQPYRFLDVTSTIDTQRLPAQ